MYRERPPEPGLGLACVWTQSTADAHAQLVVPDGCIDIIWSADGIQVAGPDTRPRVEGLAGGARLEAVRFRPGAAPHVLGVPAEALRDHMVGLEELWGCEAGRVGDAASGGDPVLVLQRVMAGRLRRAGPPDPAVEATVAALVSGESVGATAERLGLSDRQLRRRCLAAFGYGPKTLQRILRFQRALRLARQDVPFAAVAYAEGYADQAHLAHEVREFGGATLSDLR
jgi:AraC-like DNA-binding protein